MSTSPADPSPADSAACIEGASEGAPSYRWEPQRSVAAFHLALDIPAPSSPSALGPRHYLRADLINEEAAEFRAAAERGDTLEMIDALCDILYVTFGCFVEMGIDAVPFFREVQAANMRKVGGPIRADGKRLKPPGWTPPDHRRVWADVYGDLPVVEEPHDCGDREIVTAIPARSIVEEEPERFEAAGDEIECLPSRDHEPPVDDERRHAIRRLVEHVAAMPDKKQAAYRKRHQIKDVSSWAHSLNDTSLASALGQFEGEEGA